MHTAGQQQVVQQVAPTFIQLLTLQYTAEQLLKEETGKSQLASPNQILNCKCKPLDCSACSFLVRLTICPQTSS